MKTCTKCNLNKELSEFYFKKGKPRSQCKECEKTYARKWNVEHAEKYKENLLKWKEENRERHLEHGRNHYQRVKNDPIAYMKQQARSKVGHAIEQGELLRQSCEVCDLGVTETSIQAHHEDYTKPLEVVWLCNECHRNRHVKKEFGQ